jgi:hypothetical protein
MCLEIANMAVRGSVWMSVVWLLLGPSFVYHGFRKEPILYRNWKRPVPDQKFARASFVVLGLVFIVEGLWNLWVGGIAR